MKKYTHDYLIAVSGIIERKLFYNYMHEIKRIMYY